MLHRTRSVLLAVFAFTLLAAPATALPIVANPETVTLDSILPDFLGGGSLTLDYLGGDTSDNKLFFKATADSRVLDLAALTFDVPVVDSDLMSDPDNLLALSFDIGPSTVGAIATAVLSDKMATFYVELGSTPTMAWLTHFDPAELHSRDKQIFSKTKIRFDVVPEPSAALVFGTGFAVVSLARRRRSA